MKQNLLFRICSLAAIFTVLFFAEGCHKEVTLLAPSQDTGATNVSPSYREAYATPFVDQGNVRGFVFKPQINRPIQFGPEYLLLSDWGWVIRVFNLDLPIVRHQYDFPVYAGTSPDSLWSGTLVGAVHFNILNAATEEYTLAVQYDLLPGWLLYEVELYMDPIAPTSTSPADWGFSQLLDTPSGVFETTFTRNLLPEGHVYLIARAIVKKLE